MEQITGQQLIVDAVLIVVITIVLGWVEWRGRPEQHVEPYRARYRRRARPGRKAA